mmetsp:Transcript_107935/g.336651  ORF Transcript_107935/g.336651 Transcript_107935/m.336651 type:complete len:288 (+) Transcript_107935:103-966(+)|eukprot:CAMPEP_0204584418 /NCGR_PEP_ID=MMETSP0661-20131031/46327_1 /ASSEMBLY_ACC=CAM_ASM_000606 /TAXON_ID=109239 /ORGANISM="Alexandrium margalefi, Strain AMGDE01CS-322" /LENGTH=287 /DNA_ID=CAMNT_0051593859 /DNA_START=115 /DNA_END=978 /DNA_ORIENTATION=+
MAREKTESYLAKLADQTERHGEMPQHRESVGRIPEERSVEERNRLSPAYNDAVGSRRAVGCLITSVEQKNHAKGNEAQSKYAKVFLRQGRGGAVEKCGPTLEVPEGNTAGKATAGRPSVFYPKMAADLYRYSAELSDGDSESKAAENAWPAFAAAPTFAEKDMGVLVLIRLALALIYSVFLCEVKADLCRYIVEFSDGDTEFKAVEHVWLAYAEASTVAEKVRAVMQPIRLGLTLIYSVLFERGASDLEEARRVARTAFEDATAGLDNVAEGSCRDFPRSTQLLRCT